MWTTISLQLNAYASTETLVPSVNKQAELEEHPAQARLVRFWKERVNDLSHGFRLGKLA